MGKGRDKRKKKEDPEKAVKRAARQLHKLNKGKQESDAPAGFNNEEAPEVTLKKIEKQQKKLKRTEEVPNVAPPTARVNVVLLPHPERPTDLVVFGGELWNGEVTEVYNDTYIFNTKKNSWSRINTPVNPMPRSSSQGVVYKHFIILFGGEFVSQSQSQYHHFRDVWRFDSQKSEWEELKALKGGPSARSGHRMVLWKRNAVVFGGFYDNAQECRYFDDLWILSQLDDVGKWQKVEVPSFSRPCPRSGHSLSLHENTLFVYGGYSTEKFNRFKKSEATVHHDLWMIDLSQVGSASVDSPVRWRKIKLGGIPPPIRAGVSSCFKDKKMYLFGGVVDVESPGGKVMSTFCNDLSVFHMDIERFFPIILSGKKRNDQSGPRKVVHDLEAELEELQLLAGKGSSSDSGSDSNTDSDDEDGVEKKDCEMKESFETRKNGAIYPHRRMDAAMTILGNSLYIYGGQFESGLKEITMSDLFRLNLNRNDTYEVLLSYDLSTNMWVGKEEESDNNSWESGSTVVSAAFDMDYLDDDDDDEEDDDEERDEVDFGEIPDEIQLDEGDDGEEAPQAIPANMDETGATLSHGDVADAITRIKGKKGLQVHKEQLLAQLSDSSIVPTPKRDDDFASFWDKTGTFWLDMARESSSESLTEKRLSKCAKLFAKQRFSEAKELLEQLHLVEEREIEEARFFRERRLQKEKEWEAYEREQQLNEEQEAQQDSHEVAPPQDS